MNGFALTVDVHAHVVIPEAEDLVAGRPEVRRQRELDAAHFGEESAKVNVEMIGRLAPLMTDVEKRLARMDAMGVDVQLLSPAATHYHTWAEPDLARSIARTVNEKLVKMCARRPDRLLGLGLVPVQHPYVAADELTHAVKELGLEGVVISTAAPGLELGDPEFETFWARAEELGALVFIHPWGCSLGERLNRHYLANIVGQPTETTVALSHMIFSGLFDRRPNLKVLAAHGGGYLPFYPGRSDHAWEVRPDSRTPRRRPSSYLKKIYYDSLVYETGALANLVAQVGAEQVMMGTDYPLDMGVEDPLARIEAVHELSAEEKLAIRGGNAARVLNLSALLNATPSGEASR